MKIEENYSRITSYKTKLGSIKMQGKMIVGIVIFVVVLAFFDKPKPEAILVYILIVLIAYYFVNRNTQKFIRMESFIFISKACLDDHGLMNHDKEFINSTALRILEWGILEKKKIYLNDKYLLNSHEPESLTGLERDQFWIARYIQSEHIASAKLEYPSLDVDNILSIQKRSIQYKEREDASTLRGIRSAEIESEMTGKSFNEIYTLRLKEFDNSEKEKERIEQERKDRLARSSIKIVTGICPYCLKNIPKLAKKCPYCTADF